MSMRINNLFEHDDLMKRHSENAETNTNHINMTTTANGSGSNNNFDSIPEDEPITKSAGKAGGNTKTPAQRHRASIACASCRDRRIRCVVPAGESECQQCKRSKTECIIKNDDERRRPVSKAYMSSLTDRVALLEGMLVDSGKDIPPANHPPKTRVEAPLPSNLVNQPSNQPQYQSSENNTSQAENASPRSVQDGSTDGEGYHNDMSMSMGDVHPPARTKGHKKEGLVHMLLSTRGHLSFDQLSGRLRFFGPASNFHIYADQNAPVEQRETPEQVRRTERIIRSLSIDTHDYLMNTFWDNYNSVLQIVHRGAFEEDMANSRNKYYSGFLHISILAMGYRFADLERDDMKKITGGDRECTLHREAKYMLDMELERPGGIPSVQAFLLLGDLECGVGRDNTGWMYAGMANRLCFDLGLHLDCQNDGLEEKDVQIRHMTLFACVIYDKYWALFLGRPTAIKSADLEMYRLSRQFGSLSACQPAGGQKSWETQIYEELLDLMELAGKISEIKDSEAQTSQDPDRANSAYLNVMNLDRQLQTWYRKLPDNLVWKPENIANAPFSFFLLHQQYHCSLILLHRPWARYEDPTPPSSEDGNEDDSYLNIDDNHSFLSRSICTRQAIRVARIFWHHRQRFDTRRIFVTGIQHAGTAATALVAALAFIKNMNDRKNNMQYLECLAGALHDMSYTYQPAASMSRILQAVMTELQNVNNQKTPPPEWRTSRSDSMNMPKPSSIPARRDSTAMETEDLRTFKKRQMSKTATRPSLSSLSNPPSTNNIPSSSQIFSPQKPTPQSHRAQHQQTQSAQLQQTQSMPLPNQGPSPQSQLSQTTSNDYSKMPLDPELMNPPAPASTTDSSSFVMITPRSERAIWPTLNNDLNALDYPMGFTGLSGMGVNGWMGAEGLSPFTAGQLEAGLNGGNGNGVHGENGTDADLDFFGYGM